MAIDLKYSDPKTIEKVNENLAELSSVAIHKKVVDIDTTTIAEAMTGDSEKLRLVLLNLINNLKAS